MHAGVPMPVVTRVLELYSMCVLPAGVLAAVLQFGAKFGAAFGKVMFAADAAASSTAADELTAALQWVEGELAKSEGPLFIGKELSLVRYTAGLGAAGASFFSLHSYQVHSHYTAGMGAAL